MNEEGSVVALNDVNSNLVPKESFYQKNKKLVITFFISIGVLIIVAILAIISVVLNKNSKDQEASLGDIICVFNIKKINENIKILGDDYIKNSNFKIFIDGKEIKYSKEYKFLKYGENIVTFSLLEDINMDKMFKDLDYLISVNITSKSNLKILSMESTFENCNFLKN